MSGMLYLVGTPIGNLEDLSERAARTLADVDFIAAEDTRVSVKLLNHLGLKKPLVSYYEQNKRQRGEEILRRLLGGESCALVTDAGMPAISDPGEDMVALCAENGVSVSVVPGPCAAVSALAVSGLPTGRFSFEGFLSTNKKNRREHLAQIARDSRTLLFYEAPHKLKTTLADLYAAFGDRRVALVRELTKLHEEVLRTTLSQVQTLYQQTEPRGEYVLVVEGWKEPPAEKKSDEDAMEEAARLVKEYVAGGMAHAAAAKRAAKETGVSRPALYRRTV